jgi:parallel beta-helix repeat protein
MTVLLLTMILFSVVFSGYFGGHSIETRTMSIIDSVTGQNTVVLGNDIQPFPEGGYNFTANVTLNGETNDLATYQVAIKYNHSIVNCTAAWIDKYDPTFIFGEEREKALVQSPWFSPQATYVMLGATVIGSYVNVTEGLLCQMNFTVLMQGTSIVEIILSSTRDDNSFLLDYNVHDILFTAQNLIVTANAAPSSPIASFIAGPDTPDAGQDVMFDASGSYDPDGYISSYQWDFGDGNITTIVQPTLVHTFASKGVYAVKLTVFDNDGFNGSTTVAVQVGVRPTPSFSLVPQQPLKYENVTFDASMSFDVDGGITLYSWAFSLFAFGFEYTKVIYSPVLTWSENTTQPILVENFTSNGLHEVKLTVFDNDGLHNSTVQSISIGAQPTADFNFSPENPDPFVEVVFNGSLSSDLDGQIIYVIWNFVYFPVGPPQPLDIGLKAHDVMFQEDLVETYVYESGGPWDVNLTVFDNDGLSNSIIKTVNVTDIPMPETYIRESGAVDPQTAPIESADNSTYVLTGYLNGSLTIERDDITLNGTGNDVQTSVTISGRTNITVTLLSCSNLIVDSSSGIDVSDIGIGWIFGGLSIFGSSAINVSRINSTRIDCYDSTSISILHNNITGDLHSGGLFIDEVTSSIFIGNRVVKCGGGMALAFSSNNLLKDNSLLGNHQNFALLYRSEEELINDVDSSNTIDGNPICYWIDKSDLTVPAGAGCLILVNCSRILARALNLNRNLHGALLHNTNNSIIMDSNITENFHGVHLDSSSNNAIYHNNFIDNVHAAVYQKGNCSQVWDNGYPSGGNYWYDRYFSLSYPMQDTKSGPFQNETGSDGISDRSLWNGYTNVNYPLMGPFHTFDVGEWNGTECSVNIISSSSISQITLDTDNNALSFNVTGSAGEAFSRIVIPNTVVQDLWQGNFTVLINGQSWPSTNMTDDAYTYIYINYTHSEHQVVIVPEYAPNLIIPLLMSLTLLLFVMRKGKSQNKRKIS